MCVHPQSAAVLLLLFFLSRFSRRKPWLWCGVVQVAALVAQQHQQLLASAGMAPTHTAQQSPDEAYVSRPGGVAAPASAPASASASSLRDRSRRGPKRHGSKRKAQPAPAALHRGTNTGEVSDTPDANATPAPHPSPRAVSPRILELGQATPGLFGSMSSFSSSASSTAGPPALTPQEAQELVSCRLWVVGCRLWVVGRGLWAVGCGLWAVGCVMCLGASRVCVRVWSTRLTLCLCAVA